MFNYINLPEGWVFKELNQNRIMAYKNAQVQGWFTSSSKEQAAISAANWAFNYEKKELESVQICGYLPLV